MQKEPQQQQAALTSELSLELLELLKDNRKQVKYGTINAILQYTPGKQQKQMFNKPEFYIQILRAINTPELTKICLSTLIHFSADTIGDQQKFEQNFVRFVQPLTFQLKNWKDKQQQLALLLFFNISKFSSVSQKLIGQGQTQGYSFQVLYAKMEQKPQLRWMIANVFANISSTEEGRKFMNERKFHIRFFNFLLDKQERVRIPILKILRNMSFLWEQQDFIKQILSEKHFFLDKIAQNIALTLFKSKIIKKQNQKILKVIEKYGVSQQKLKDFEATDKNSIISLETAIDIILILSNANFQQIKPPLKMNQLRDLITFLKFTDIEQATKDKLDALQTFCFW